MRRPTRFPRRAGSPSTGQDGRSFRQSSHLAAVESWEHRVVSDDDVWRDLASPFVDGAYATVKGQVRTYVMHRQLVRHLPDPPASVLDVGGGAAHQSLPLARLGYQVTVLDPSPAMLSKAAARLA